MPAELSIEDRREKAARELSVKGFMSLGELVRVLGVSESTIRRDLEVLEEQGLIRRTHGGAVYVQDTGGHRLAFAERESAAQPQKQAIARAVAGLIPPAQTVILNGGTTCYEVAKALRGRHLNVITNSVPIASLLSTEMETEVALIGGYVYPRTGVALGATAEQQLDTLHATQLVMSCAGITREGAFNSNQMMVDVERKMKTVADEAILAVDHTKFGRRAVTKLCGLDELDVIVTDADAPRQVRSWLDELDVRVIYAE